MILDSRLRLANKYSFFKDINGRALMRLTDEKLSRIGVDHPNHRYEILNEILKQVWLSW